MPVQVEGYRTPVSQTSSWTGLLGWGAVGFAGGLALLAVQARKPIVGGNWKSNGTLASAKELVEELNKGSWDGSKVDVVVCPPSIQIPAVQGMVKDDIKVAIQNCSATGMGAYTGEVTVEHIKDAGLEWVVIGHSERRSLYGEDDAVCAKKLERAMEAGLKVIYCIGEQLPERESGKTNEVLQTQMEAVYAVENVKWEDIVIAYEPVWAIGTGKVATPAQAEDAHEFIRKLTAKNKTPEIAAGLRIQYGGSVSAANCVELSALPDVDGFLVGGASLKPEFVTIIEAAQGEDTDDEKEEGQKKEKVKA
jgi:triosephosphate isomerase